MPDPNNPYNVDQSLWGQMSGNDMNIFNQTMANAGRTSSELAAPGGGDAMRNQLAQMQAQQQQGQQWMQMPQQQMPQPQPQQAAYGGGGWGGGYGSPVGNMSGSDWATFSGIV